MTSNQLMIILERLGLEPEDKDRYILLRCPACNHKEAFIYKHKDYIICNRRNKCDYSISIWNLLKETKGFNLAELSKDEEFEEVDLIHKDEELKIPEGLHFFSEKNNSIIKDVALRYLHSRHIPQENIDKLGYIYSPGTDYDKRIFIPFYENGKMVYFIARDFTGKNKLRYNNPKGIGGTDKVYNIDIIDYGETVFIFEGIFDAISLRRQIGTAILSNNLRTGQAIKIVNKCPKNIVFVPDMDDAGRESLERNISMIKKYSPPSLDIKIFIYYTKGYKDFNESKLNSIGLDECEEYKKFNLKKMLWNRMEVV
jgi:hypothetical protein